MNILFIEDEEELAATGVLQLETKGYTVFPAFNVEEARAILDDPKNKVHYVIADHRLPGMTGIDFLIELTERICPSRFAIVSGCLTDADIERLKKHQIAYYHKPLLYGKVIDELRRLRAAKAPVKNEALNADSTNALSAPLKKQPKPLKFWPFSK
jgi:DNA-binding NtrC family response regulator